MVRAVRVAERRRGLAACVVAALVAALLSVAGPVQRTVAALDDASPKRYIVELDPTAVSPWLARVGGDFGDALRVHTVKSRVMNAADELVFDYGELPYVAVEVDDPEALAAVDGVVSVKPEVLAYRQLDTTLGVIGATDGDLDGLLAGTRLDGRGWAVAVIDDGIDLDHPYFNTGGSRIVAEGCYVTDSSCPGTTQSSTAAGSAAHPGSATHGTHVAGIAVGDRGSGLRRGVARAASLIPIRVFDLDGGASQSSIDAALQRVLTLTNTVSVAAVNLSLGTSTAYRNTCDSLLSSSTFDLVAGLRDRGVVTVVASGNGGFIDGISWPGCLSNVVPVAASTNADVMASFSNVSTRVSTSGLTAPGVGVRSAVSAPGAVNAEAALSGTSMATPHVAGAVALLRQAVGGGPPADQIIAKLRTTDVFVDDIVVKSIPRLSVTSAVEASLPSGVSGVLSDGTGSTPTVLGSTPVTLSFVPDSAPGGTAFQASVVTSPTGSFRILGLATGSWTASVSAARYLTPLSSQVVINSNAVTTWNTSLMAPTGAIAGTVSVSGLPRSVTFTFTPSAGNLWSAFTTTAAVPADGTFTVQGVRTGSWTVEARSGTSASPPISATVSEGTTAPLGVLELVNLTATWSATLTSSLTAAAVASRSTLLEFVPTGVADDRVAFATSVTTNGSGVIDIAGLRLGDWSVTVSATGFQPTVSTFSLATANQVQATPVSVTPLAGSVAGVLSLTGEVEDGSAALSVRPQVSSNTATLVFVPTGNTTGRAQVTRTVDVGSTGGSFIVTNLLPGGWLASASQFGYVSRASESVSVEGGQATTDVQIIMDPVVQLSSTTPMTPTLGPAAGGTTVTLSGIHLDKVTRVNVGSGAVTTFTTRTSEQLVFTTPPGSGAAAVTLVAAPTVTVSAANLTFSYQAAAAPSDPGSGSPPPAGGGGAAGGGAGGGGSSGGSTGSDPAPVTAQIAAPSRPGGTVSVDVELTGGVLGLAFAGVAGTGEVQVQERTGTPPSGAQGLRLLGRYVDISASGVQFDRAELCVPFTADDAEALEVAPSQMRLLHFAGDLGRRDITTRVDTTRRLVCGVTDSFSPFAIGVPATERVAGIDRYTTAVNLSSTFFPDGARTVYLASGTGFADALAAGASAAQAGGPVLLTTPGSLPSAVRAELARLAPSQVVIVGGSSAVSATVDAAVRAAVPRATVTRVAGSNRYATAVEVSKRTFPTGATTVYVATGLSFPDALAGASAAGRDGAPVLLVPGTTVPSVVVAELTRLRPQRVVLLGGSAALSSAVASAVATAVPGATVSRLQGADRYATAASVAGTFDRGSPVFAATGRTFPDALAGAAVAGGQQGPVVVVPDGVLPASLTRALGRLAPSRLVVLGGTGALSNSVELQLARFLP